MAEPFKPNRPTNINNGVKYQDKDGVQPETLNQVVEAVLYILGLTGGMQTLTDSGNTRVEIDEDVNGYPRFKFYNIKGQQGEVGRPGVSIESITNQYAINNTPFTAPTTWYVNSTAPTSSQRYAWIKQTITYTDGTKQEIKPYVYGVAGEQGIQGDKGETGLRFVSLSVTASSEEIYRRFVTQYDDTLNVEIPFGLWLYDVPELSGYDNNAVFLVHGASIENPETNIKQYTFGSIFATPDSTSYKIVVIISISNDPTQCSIETSVTQI